MIESVPRTSSRTCRKKQQPTGQVELVPESYAKPYRLRDRKISLDAIKPIEAEYQIRGWRGHGVDSAARQIQADLLRYCNRERLPMTESSLCSGQPR